MAARRPEAPLPQGRAIAFGPAGHPGAAERSPGSMPTEAAGSGSAVFMDSGLALRAIRNDGGETLIAKCNHPAARGRRQIPISRPKRLITSYINQTMIFA